MVPLEIAARGKALYAMTRRATAMLFCLFFPPLFATYGGFKMFTALSLLTFACALPGPLHAAAEFRCIFWPARLPVAAG